MARLTQDISLLFGPTRTTLSARISSALKALIVVSDAEDVKNAYVFHGPTGAAQPHSPSSWCAMIKKCFQRHSGIALAPKGEFDPSAPHPSVLIC